MDRGETMKGHHTANSAETREKIASRMRGMMPVWKRPTRCQKCGAEVRRSLIERWRGEWLCGDCLNGTLEPLSIDDFVYSGTSNLADAEPDGPDGIMGEVESVRTRGRMRGA
jgi:hypothetical protein